MMAFAEEEARRHGARLLELTSNKARQAAHRFYERIGFANTHEGFKKKLV
jgi:GNAT superfamily N-acetyltransferase